MVRALLKRERSNAMVLASETFESGCAHSMGMSSSSSFATRVTKAWKPWSSCHGKFMRLPKLLQHSARKRDDGKRADRRRHRGRRAASERPLETVDRARAGHAYRRDL